MHLVNPGYLGSHTLAPEANSHMNEMANFAADWNIALGLDENISTIG